MKILLAIILIFPIFNIVAQNPVQPKDSTVGKDEKKSIPIPLN